MNLEIKPNKNITATEIKHLEDKVISERATVLRERAEKETKRILLKVIANALQRARDSQS